jgi:hypothetical protein
MVFKKAEIFQEGLEATPYQQIDDTSPLERAKRAKRTPCSRSGTREAELGKRNSGSRTREAELGFSCKKVKKWYLDKIRISDPVSGF